MNWLLAYKAFSIALGAALIIATWTVNRDAPERRKLERARRAMQRLQKRRVALIKHVNNYTPVGRRVNRYDPKYPASCPTCQAPEETAEHLVTAH